MSRAPLVLLLLLALAAPAWADHVYSHRFMFEGRLVGADGAPLANRTVEFFAVDGSFVEPCQEPSQPVTDEAGDFRFCFHKHELDVRTRVGVRVGNATVEKPMDTGFRKTVVILVEPNETAPAPEGWNQSHLVAGRVWRPGPQTLENVRVYGAAVPHVAVNLTLRTPEGGRTDLQVTTDRYGDFRAPLRLLDSDDANVSVEIEVLGQRQTRPLDPFSHRITVGVILPAEDTAAPPDAEPPSDAEPIDTAFPDSVPPTYPGEVAGPIAPGLVLAVLAGVGGAIFLAAKQRK